MFFVQKYNFFQMIGQKIIAWYKRNKRILPWRDTENPYLIWVSEVILQQTRVNQGLNYYNRFVKTFPDVQTLASAEMDQVLKLWQGLGYYSRARNMHAAAQDIMVRFGGQFPKTYKELITIKGIGDYTASAIASFSFGEAVPVIDGNVMRVMSRLFGISDPINKSQGRKKIRDYAEKTIVRESPGIYNQAVMEFGALQCVPSNPDCEICVLENICEARRLDVVAYLPVKDEVVKVKTRYFNYIIINHGKYTYIQKRESKDIWAGLYEFPMIETEQPVDIGFLQQTDTWKHWFSGNNLQITRISPEITHRLTHRILKVRFYEVLVDQPVDLRTQIIWDDIAGYAVPRVIENYLNMR